MPRGGTTDSASAPDGWRLGEEVGGIKCPLAHRRTCSQPSSSRPRLAGSFLCGPFL